MVLTAPTTNMPYYDPSPNYTYYYPYWSVLPYPQNPQQAHYHFYNGLTEEEIRKIIREEIKSILKKL